MATPRSARDSSFSIWSKDLVGWATDGVGHRPSRGQQVFQRDPIQRLMHVLVQDHGQPKAKRDFIRWDCATVVLKSTTTARRFLKVLLP